MTQNANLCLDGLEMAAGVEDLVENTHFELRSVLCFNSRLRSKLVLGCGVIDIVFVLDGIGDENKGIVRTWQLGNAFIAKGIAIYEWASQVRIIPKRIH